MKKTFIVFAAIAFIASCGDDKKPAAGSNPAAAEIKKVDLSSNPDYTKGLALLTASNNDCLGCHKIDDVLTGPSYKQVAEKYAGREPAIVDSLAQRIISGHSGIWGDQVMTAHPNLSEADAKAMVKYILLLNQQ